MAIKVADNTERIESETKRCISEIEENANKGNSITELYIPKEIGYDVKRKIKETFDADGTVYRFLTVKRSPNQYTGCIQSFIGETIGDEKHFKIKIL